MVNRVAPLSSHAMNSISPPRDRRTGPYDADFKDMLIQGRIYPNGYEYSDGQRPQEPNNLDEVVQRLSQPQPALESTVSNRKFQEYFNANLDASNETDVKDSVFIIFDSHWQFRYC